MAALRPPALVIILACAGCGAAPPPPAPPPVALARPPAPDIDTSAVPEPPGLVALGRVNKPEALLSVAGGWAHMPLPPITELARSLADDSVADVVDLSRPVDAAVSLSLSRHGLEPLVAVSVVVKSFDDAKTRLGMQHRLVPGPNGQLNVSGIGRSGPPRPAAAANDEDDEDDDHSCVLAHAPSNGARLVCGESAALEALAPYLSRTMPRSTFKSDIHVELRPAPVKGPLSALRAMFPSLGRSLTGKSSPELDELLGASLGEVSDFVDDAQKVAIDAQIDDHGVVATARFELQGKKSVIAQMMTASDRTAEAPPAFWHLPGDADTAFFGQGADPKLFEHPRELLSKLLFGAAGASGMPEAERKAVRDLVADRMLTLFSGPGIYAKGFDAAAVDKALAARSALKPEDTPAQEESRRVLVEQVVGWHLYRTSEPIAKVGPMLKEWALLWNRPALAGWAKANAGKALPKLRIAPLPSAVVLPKETVHLELTVPRDDVDDQRPSAARGAKKPPKVARKPGVFHVFAVPDGGQTWLGFGMDAKLVAQKAAASLASAPETGTLGKGGSFEPLRNDKLNAGLFGTLRGLLVLGAADGGDTYAAVRGLPNKGDAPVFLLSKAEGSGAGGVSTTTLRIPRPFIEDVVKLVVTR